VKRIEPSSAATTPSRGDGSQYLYLSPKYFEPKGIGYSIGARILLKFLTGETLTSGYEGHFARSHLLRAGCFPKRTSDRYLRELIKGKSLVCTKADQDGGFRYRVRPELVGRTGEGFNFACEPMRNGIFSLITNSEQFFFEFLSYRAFQSESLFVEFSDRELFEDTGLSAGTIKRTRARLHSMRFLAAQDRRQGNGAKGYLLNPMCVWGPLRSGFSHFEKSILALCLDHFGAAQLDHFGASGNDLDHFGAPIGSNWRNHTASRVPNDAPSSDHFGADLYSCITSLVDGAPRYGAPNESAGGVGADPSEAGRRCPAGQDHTASEKGVGLTADEIFTQLRTLQDAFFEKKISESEFIQKAEALRGARSALLNSKASRSERTKKTVGSGRQEQFPCPT
jgi:hypothetical protein